MEYGMKNSFVSWVKDLMKSVLSVGKSWRATSFESQTPSPTASSEAVSPSSSEKVTSKLPSIGVLDEHSSRMSCVGSLPHKVKCEDLIEGQIDAAYKIGHRTWDAYVAAKPQGKD